MFNGNRKFDGHQGYQILNKNMYLQYEILKQFLAEKEPETDVNGALWLDKTNEGNVMLKFKNGDTWENIFDKYFKLIEDLHAEEEPLNNNVIGKLWIDSNGIMYYFDGSIYRPIKSSSVDISDLSINASAFENFMMIDPLNNSGDYIIDNITNTPANKLSAWKANTSHLADDVVYASSGDGIKFYKYPAAATSKSTLEEDIANGLVEVSIKSQFLIPSEKSDKVFLNSEYMKDTDYEVQSNVCIDIDNSVYFGKNIAATHVNPSALKRIVKRIIKVPESGNINVPSNNTEYYGIIEDSGVFLYKNTGAIKKDYSVTASGIQLNKNSDGKFNYTYIYCLTYEFETMVKNRGVVYKKNLNLSNRTEIKIGANRTYPVVFAQGMQVDKELYTYDSAKDTSIIFKGYDASGNLTTDENSIVTPMFVNKTDMAVIELERQQNNIAIENVTEYTTGTGTSAITKYKGTINIPSDYIEPIIFIQGVMIKPEFKTSQQIDNLDPNNATCTIVDMCDKDNNSLFVSSGITDATLQIQLSEDIISGEYKPLLFVNGLYVSSADLDRISSPGYLKVNGLVEGLEYTLFKTKAEPAETLLLYDGTISFSTITFDKGINDAVMFFDNKLLIDQDACKEIAGAESTHINNEIKLFIINGSEVWKQFNESTKTWSELPADESTLLTTITDGYSISSDTISVLKNIDKNDSCSILAYAFANRIEKPLLKGMCSDYSVKEIEGIQYAFYQIDKNYHYTKNKNSLQVWMNGVKQRFQEYENADEAIPVQGFLIQKDFVDKYHPTFYYVIEEPETNENKSFVYEDISNSDSTSKGIYNTASTLYPGIVTLYVDGYRQPNNCFNILSANSMSICPPLPLSELSKGSLGYNPEYVSKIEIEVRKDFSLCEKAIILDQEFIDNHPNQITFSADDIISGQKMPSKLFKANKSEINIYINGANYGDSFEKYDNIIVFENENVWTYKDNRTFGKSAYLKAGDVIIFEWR